MKNMQYLASLAFTEADFKQLRENVTSLLLTKQRDQATEIMVKVFVSKNKVYAVRDDDKNEVWIYKDGIFVPDGISYITEFCRKVLGVAYTTHIKNLVAEKIQADHYINKEEFFNYVQDINVIPVQNGLLNLKTREISPFSSEFIFFNKLPIKFDASKDCPKIKNFFETICSDKRDIKTMQQFIGTILQKTNKYERMVMVIGNGRNGKSKIADLIKRFVGSENVSGLQPSTFENPESFQTYLLHGKLVNMYVDISKNALKNTSLLKSLSGQDTISVPRKFKAPLTFYNTCKFIFGANELPMSYDVTDGFWERWLLIDLPYTFVYPDRLSKVEKKYRHLYKERIDNIVDLIATEEELSGFLNWVLDGLEELEKNKQISYKYTPDEVKIIWTRKSDSFMAYYMDCLEDDQESRISKEELRKSYSQYCKKHHLKPMSDKVIHNRMMEQGCFDGRVRNEREDVYYWEGVRFKKMYQGFVDINNIQHFKNPTFKEEVFSYLDKVESANKEDLVLRFDKENIEKMLLTGELIENPMNCVRVNR